MRLIHLTLALIVLADPGNAQGCPPMPDRAAERAALLDTLANATTAMTGNLAANAVWAFWVRAPDDRAQTLLDAGMRGIREGNPAGAEETLNDLVAYCPDFPEGWNQRAFARFLQSDFAGSLSDIDETLLREPAHFGALAGKIRILVHQGRQQLARLALIDALAIHPWLQEGALLGRGGKDI